MIKNIKFHAISAMATEAYSSGEGFQGSGVLTLETLKILEWSSVFRLNCRKLQLLQTSRNLKGLLC